MLRDVVKTLTQALISGSFGCLDSAAETINARWGSGSSKGTLSKKLSGHLKFTVDDIIALEDASGQFPVTRMLARRLACSGTMPAGCLIHQSGVISREVGEAVAAILAADQSSKADDAAQAIAEIVEAEQALQAARERLTEADQR